MTDKNKRAGTKTGTRSRTEPGTGAKAKTKPGTGAKTKTKPGTRLKAKAGSPAKPKSRSGTEGRPRSDSRSGVKTGHQVPEGEVSPEELLFDEADTSDKERTVALEKQGRPGAGTDKPVIYDPVSAYYQTIRHYPVLTRDEEKELGIRYLETEDVDAAYTLVTSNLKLVIKIALEYRRLWREIVDLIQEGNVGLMQAVKKYDPYRGVRFSSYAAWWIRAYIIRYIMNNTRMVKIGTTQAQRTLYFQLGKERERLRRMGIEPDSKAIAKSLNLKESEVEEMSMRLSTGDLSLEAKRGQDGDFSLYDTIPALEPDTESKVADAETRSLYLEKLSTFVATLADRDRKIFTMRWMSDEPMTLQQVGQELGITRERVRQLEARIIKNLREHLENEGLSASDFFS